MYIFLSKNQEFNDFLRKWSKIKSLYDDETIDNEIYNTLVDSIIEKYKSIDVRYDNSGLDDLNF